MQSGEPLGCVAQTSWHHPELGDVEQGYFAQLAESNGLITDINQQILLEVCCQMVPGGKLADQGLVTVNLSAANLSQAKSLQQLLDIVKASNIDARKLCFEFDEASLLKLDDVHFAAFKRIKQTGVSIAIQGFGTGVSSLGLVTQNAVDYVMVDSELTRNLAQEKQMAVLQALMNLSLAFDYKVILQGIDNEPLLQLACDSNVYIGQGVHFDQKAELEAAKQVERPVLTLHKFA